MKYVSSHRAFTLIELLVVISIIGILAGLSFTGVNAALTAARRTQAKNDVVQIANAVLAFESEYGRLPVRGAGSTNAGDVDGNLMRVLTATEDLEDGQSALNPRKISFIEISPAKNKKSGTNESGTFVDPWGNAYRIVLDSAYAGSITAGEPKGPAVVDKLLRRVAVWNWTNAESRIPVSSWD